MKIDFDKFTLRVKNCLKINGIITNYQLNKTPAKTLLNYRNFGLNSLIEVNQYLKNLKLPIKEIVINKQGVTYI